MLSSVKKLKERYKIIIISGILLALAAAGAFAWRHPQFFRNAQTAEDNFQSWVESAVSTATDDKEEAGNGGENDIPEDDPPIKEDLKSVVSTENSYAENFSDDYLVKEINHKDESNSPYWWVSSGAYFHSADGVGSTAMGDLGKSDPRFKSYAKSNPEDTDKGAHPQNIFRLVLKRQWKNFTQEAYFQIKADNLSDSPNRNESNGLLLFNRYQDESNLYYAGIRVDGYAVIKKKYKEKYYTMAYQPIFSGQEYDPDDNPNLLPKNTWIGLRSVVDTIDDGKVSLKLYVDKGKTGKWVLAAEAVDNGKKYGGKAIAKKGYSGIRTDFMDVEVDDYRISEH